MQEQPGGESLAVLLECTGEFQHYRESYPVRARLLQLAARLYESSGTAGNAYRQIQTPKTLAAFEAITCDFLEVCSWLLGELSPSPVGAVEIERFITDRWSAELIAEYRKHAGKRPRGRPVSLRPQVVAAVELRDKNTGASWPDVARKCCPDKGCKHGKSCSERFRIEALTLKKLLRRHET